VSEPAEYGTPEVEYSRSGPLWYAQIKVPACPFRNGYLGYVGNSCFGLTRRGTERRAGRLIRRLEAGKCFVF